MKLQIPTCSIQRLSGFQSRGTRADQSASKLVALHTLARSHRAQFSAKRMECDQLAGALLDLGVFRRAFTLLELLTVISIIGILAAIALPALKSLKPNIQASGARQLLDDINRARQLAISQRTTVYMIFAPSNFWNDAAFSNLGAAEKTKTDRLTDKQLIGYTYVSLRGVGDQPGRPTARYWSSWKTLPQGSFIPLEKFGPRNTYVDIYTNPPPTLAYRIYGFNKTNSIPFPSEDAVTNNNNSKVFVSVPYIAFNYLGQLESGQNEFIPVSQGGVTFTRDPNTGGVKPQTLPGVVESPPGSFTNTYSLVNIDWVTGRARIEHQEVR